MQCDVGLVCFQREEPVDGVWAEVPGCEGGKDFTVKTDFCIKAPVSEAVEATLEPTEETTEVMQTTMPTTAGYGNLPMLDSLTLMVPTVPLGLCQG